MLNGEFRLYSMRPLIWNLLAKVLHPKNFYLDVGSRHAKHVAITKAKGVFFRGQSFSPMKNIEAEVRISE
jgi:hypothetical protein